MKITEEPPYKVFLPADDKADSDYHQIMDGEAFMQSVERLLVPALSTCVPGKTIILIIDNAPYYHAIADCWRDPLKLTKSESSDTQRSPGVSLTSAKRVVKHVNLAVPASSAFHRAPKRPDIDEVRRATFRSLRTHAPDRLLTRAER